MATGFTCPNCGAALPASAICPDCSGGAVTEIPQGAERIPDGWADTGQGPAGPGETQSGD